MRLDTPSTRRGDFRRIIEEVRWELDIRGYKNVGIFVSGGIDEAEVLALRGLVAGFGVGTSVANARCIDFALDIVEREGKPSAKRGKRGGKKQVYRSRGIIGEGKDVITLAGEGAPGGDMEPLLEPMIIGGEIVAGFSFSVEEARERVKAQLQRLEWNIQ